MSIDVQKLFDKDLPAWISAHPDEVTKIGARARVHLTGDGGGVWFIDASPSGPSATRGRKSGANLCIKMSVEDFHKMMEDPRANAKRMFFSDRIKVAGSQLLAFELSRVLMLGAR